MPKEQPPIPDRSLLGPYGDEEPVRKRASDAVQSEPVAWWYRHATERDPQEFGVKPLTYADKAAGWTETPLYTHPAPAVQSEPVDAQNAADKLRHWFFRECDEGTRRHLFALFGLPVEEIRNHGIERICFNRIVKSMSAPAPAPAVQSWEDQVEALARALFPILWERECYSGRYDMGDRVEQCGKLTDKVSRAAIAAMHPTADHSALLREMVEALDGLIPQNLGDNSAVPDDAMIPIDVELREIRKARAALCKAREVLG